MNRHIYLYLLMASASWQTIAAQDAYTDSIYRQFSLDEVVVTSTRTPKFLKDTPIQTRVISAKEIARLDATNVQDLLQQELPGVEFSYAMTSRPTSISQALAAKESCFLLTASDWLARLWTTWTSPDSTWTMWSA